MILSATTHVTDIVSKAHRRAKLILRTFISQDVNLLVRAFITYVRPLLEYNTVIWSPHTARDIDAIECVQRRFTKGRFHRLGLTLQLANPWLRVNQGLSPACVPS